MHSAEYIEHGVRAVNRKSLIVNGEKIHTEHDGVSERLKVKG